MSKYPLPESDQIKTLLHSILASPVEVKDASSIDASSLQVAAAYATDDGDIGAVCLCDLGAANYLGAALTLIPPAVAGENAKAGRVDGPILENLHEVLNICVSLFASPHLPRLFLRDVAVSGRDLPEDVPRALQEASGRLDVDVEVGRYGSGQMRFVVT